MTVRYISLSTRSTYLLPICLILFARNICTILSRNLPIATKLFSLGTLPKKSDPEAYFLAHCQEIPARGRYLFILHVQNILHSSTYAHQTCLINKSLPNFTQRFVHIFPPIHGIMKNSRTTKTTVQKLNF